MHVRKSEVLVLELWGMWSNPLLVIPVRVPSMGQIELFNPLKIISSSYLVWFYGISTIVGYLMPNHLYTYI